MSYKDLQYMIGVWLVLIVLSACLSSEHEHSRSYSATESAQQKQAMTNDEMMSRQVLKHDQLSREYYVFTPTDYDTQLATLIFLHGYGGTATGTQAESTNGLNRYAQQFGYRVIYPQGTWFIDKAADGSENVVSSWNDLGGNQDDGPLGQLCSADAERYPCPPECESCGRCGWTSCHDDVGFIGSLITQIRSDFPDSGENLFISGFSNGSMMAQRVACVYPDQLSAVALVGGRLELGYSCSPRIALPILQITGGQDSVVPYEGRLDDSQFFYTSAETVADEWAQANGCQVEEQHIEFGGVSMNQLICHTRCPGTLQESTNCYWPAGAHVWPGYPPAHGSNGYCVSQEQKLSIPQSQLCEQPNSEVDVWGSRVLFEFFDRHRQ